MSTILDQIKDYALQAIEQPMPARMEVGRAAQEHLNQLPSRDTHVTPMSALFGVPIVLSEALAPGSPAPLCTCGRLEGHALHTDNVAETARRDDELRAFLDRNPDVLRKFLEREARRDPRRLDDFLRDRARERGQRYP